MKRAITLFFCVSLLTTILGEDNYYSIESCGFAASEDIDYRPFVENGKSWVVTYSVCHGMMPVFKTEHWFIDGDTVIGSQPCKKLMLCVRDFENNTTSTSLSKLIYEQDRKVFFFPVIGDSIAANSIMLYDFAAEPGDTLLLGSFSSESDEEVQCFQIWDVPRLERDNEVFAGQMGTVYNPELTADVVFEDPNYPLYHWYEAIGSTHHPFLKIRWNYGWTGMLHLLRDCRVGDRIIYIDWRDYGLFPDLTGDGQVDIDDLNGTISQMLQRGKGCLADFNNDQKVDIDDVNIIINIMLHKE
ncbi:MAG: hypothetical protein IKR25_06115 [Muribaculaceae bacterium]|nr:hypothetical protein [Muribaculaceae bacterium]